MATKIEVASLLSKLNFEIDTQALEKFLGLTRLVRDSSAKLARNLRATNTQISDISGKLKSVNNGLNSTNSRKGASNLSNAYASLSKNVNVANSHLTRLSATLTTIDPKLTQQNVTMGSLVQKWALYAQKVKDASGELRGMRTASPASPPRSIGGARGSGVAGGGGGGGALLGGAIGAHAGRLINPAFMSAGAGAYALKEVVATGREYMKMQNVLTASSKSTEEFNMNLKYVEETTDRLGTNVSEFGSAYAKMIQATGDKMSLKQTQEIFTNFSELMVVLGSNDDDQKGIFRGMSQMFSKGKIQMEEVNQLAERNVPALAMLTRAYKELGWTQAEFEKKQQKGQIDPSEFMPLFAKYAKEFANNNGALEKALEQSQTKQGIFMNKLRKMSKDIMEAGLDKLIGQFFTGLTGLLDLLKPVAIWLIHATLGLKEFVVGLGEFAEKYPVVSGILTALIGLLVGWRVAVRLGAGMFGGFVAVVVGGLRAIKVALLKTAVFALFIGIAEVLVALYEHMNGKNNWLSVTIMWFRILGAHIRDVMTDFEFFFASIKRGFADSFVGKLISKVFGISDLQEQASKKYYEDIDKRGHIPYRIGGDPVKQKMLNENKFGNGAQDVVKRGFSQNPYISSRSNFTNTTNINLSMNGENILNTTETNPINIGGLSA